MIAMEKRPELVVRSGYEAELCVERCCFAKDDQLALQSGILPEERRWRRIFGIWREGASRIGPGTSTYLSVFTLSNDIERERSVH